jgi:hypothetical protein
MSGISGLSGCSKLWNVSDFSHLSAPSDGSGWVNSSALGDRTLHHLAGRPFSKTAFHASTAETPLQAMLVSQPGSTLATAYDLGPLSSAPVTLRDQVSRTEPVDYYRFTVDTASQLSLLLTGLTASVGVQLIQDANRNDVVDPGEAIARSTQNRDFSQTLDISLSPGTYFVQISQSRSNTAYSLNLFANPIATLFPQADATLPTTSPSNSLTTAQDLGVLSSSLSLNDFVGTADPNDYYRFTLANPSDFSLSLTNLTADADVQLLNNNGSLITRSATSGTSPESIFRTLAAGTYYIRVYQFTGDTNYTLSLTTAPANLLATYSPDYGYGLVNAAAAVAQAIGQPPFPSVANLGGTHWGLDLINAPEVWAMGYTGQGITVAVIDSGVDYNHPDLQNNIWVNPREIPGNGIDDDGNGYIDDVWGWDFVNRDNTPTDLYGHGTHIAGIIAAANNGSGITGVAYNAQIMPVRVLDEVGFGNYSEIAAGIRYATNNGAHIINLSLGGIGISNEISTAIQYATERGAVVVIASGNGGQSQPSFPANLTNQWGVAVGAITINQQLATFSNDAGAAVVNYVVAPGASIYSTTPNNTYQYYSGTSMAAPYVAGVAALILSANPSLTPAQVVSLLTSTANSSVVTV